MTLTDEFIRFINAHNLFEKKDHLLLTVSGGLDSVVLCELCHQAGFRFSIAHANFQLRGAESERDEQFVGDLAQKYQVPLFIKRFETKEFASQNKISIEMSARELRYAWFQELVEEVSGVGNQVSGSGFQVSGVRYQVSGVRNQDSPQWILTAHHANDNVETLLMNFFKGTGIKGLHGILPKQKNIIRPLLFAKKEDLIQLAKENNLSFVEDSTNSSDEYTRNYFRNQLIPGLEKVFPQVVNNLQNNIERFGEIEMLYQQSINHHKERLIEIKGTEIHIPILKLLKAQPLKTILYEIIKDYGFTPNQTNEVIQILDKESGKYVASATHKIIKNRAWLIIAPQNTTEAAHVIIDEDTNEVIFESGKLTLKKYLNSDETSPVETSLSSVITANSSENIALLDAKNLTFPLLLRRWKTGDYFYPLGMKHQKKLKKFFIDQKLSLTEKEKMWVIESDKKIIWIVGKRIDDRFKISDKTKKWIRFELGII